MVVEELFDIVDSIADLTVDDVRRHLSNSESSGGGGDGAENIIGADDSSLGGDIERKRSDTGENIGERLKHSTNRKDIKDNMNEEDSLMNKTNHHRNGKIKEDEIELKRNYCNRTDQKQNNEETEEVDKREIVQKIEEDAVKAVAEASKVVAGMINGSVSGDVATKTVMEAAKAVAALAKAAEGNLEASDIVEEVQARLQDLQALQAAIVRRETQVSRRKKVPKECQTKRPKFSCTTNTSFFTMLSQKPR